MTDPLLAPVAEASRALGWALVHFLWQGVAIAAALALVRLVLPERAARLRYLSGCAALVAMLAAPVFTFLLLHDGASGEAVAVAASPASEAPGLAPAIAGGSAIDRAAAPLWLESAREWLDPAIPWVLAVWLAGVCLLSLRLAGGWAAARRLALRGCEPAAPEWLATLARLRDALGMSRPVRLTASALAEVPSVVGWLRPVVVVPVSVLAGMTPWQIEAILAHELAHIRRHDYLVNILQSAVETLLFYHPATWWVSRQVREERERCCDDVAVELCGDPAGYVRALAELEALRAAPALALSATGGSLLGRARRLLAARDARRPSASVAGAVALALLACGWVTATAEGARGNDPSGAIGSLQPLPPPRTAPPPIAPESSDAPARISPPLLSSPPSPAGPAAAPAPNPRRRPPRSSSDAQDEPDLIDVMAELGYRRIPVEQLIALGTHGVRRDFVRGMNQLGFGRLPVDVLVSMKIHGITPTYARDLRAAGVTITRADELRAMKIHGVTPAFVREVKRLGHRPLSPDRLVELRIHRVILDRRSR
jgi:beta-lactamase regulating signal transducer with metallopeptidase domain